MDDGSVVVADASATDWPVVGNTLIFDPPYDDPALMRGFRPQGAADVLAFCSNSTAADAIFGWDVPFRYLFVWDGLSSWYVPGRPLERSKLCAWLGTTKYRDDHAILPGAPTFRRSHNARGQYVQSRPNGGKHLSSVYQRMNSTMRKSHPHEKPLEWVRAIIGACTSGVVVDPFCGSGAMLLAAKQIGRPHCGGDIDADSVALTTARLSGNVGPEPRQLSIGIE